MTLFTAEGLLRGVARDRANGVCDPKSIVHHAYVRWLHTQGMRSASRFLDDQLDGWLIGVNALHSRRAPGRTCVTALRGGAMGTRESPLNDSKGCGGVMRAAPVGLIAVNQSHAFSLGCETAAITHGHPSGYYSAGCLSAIVFHLLAGESLLDAIELLFSSVVRFRFCVALSADALARARFARASAKSGWSRIAVSKWPMARSGAAT